MSPYSSHYSKGKVLKKNFKFTIFPIESIIIFFSKNNLTAFPTELRENFLSANEDFSEL